MLVHVAKSGRQKLYASVPPSIWKTMLCEQTKCARARMSVLHVRACVLSVVCASMPMFSYTYKQN